MQKVNEDSFKKAERQTSTAQANRPQGQKYKGGH